MADYYAILKRAISGLPEPTGESRRSVYEKARTALVAQLKSFDPPLSASEITQQRLQLEDAIRKVESESAKGLLSQALNRASLPERPTSTPITTAPPSTAPSPNPSFPNTPAANPPPLSRPTPDVTVPEAGEPVTQSRFRPTPPTGPGIPPTRPPLEAPPERSDREPTGPQRPPLQRPTPTTPTPTRAPSTTVTTGTAGMRLARPQFEPITRQVSDAEPVTGPTGPTAALAGQNLSPPAAPGAPKASAVPPPLGRDRMPTINTQRRTPADATAFEQEDVTQPVANRVLKKAVTDIDRLGTATQETARRARDALAATETPLDEELSTGPTTKKTRKPLTTRDRPAAEATAGRGLNPTVQPTPKRGSRWPMLIGFIVALAVVALGAAALYTKRDVIASYLGTPKPILDLAQRGSSEKPIVKSTDRLLPDDPPAKSTPTAGVKVVTTQPITPNADPAANSQGGRTDVTPSTPAPAPAPTATAATPTQAPLPSGDVPPIAQKASLLEEAADGTSQPIQTTGTVIWQLVKSPSATPGKPDVVRLQGRIEIPGRNISLLMTMEQNTDLGLQASHLIKLEFKLPPDFDNKSVARVPGMILKLAEQARGDPLAGATAKITSNLFWIALYAADADKTKNLALIKDRGWIDIPIVYETNKRAMLTLEKAGAGDHVFADALAAWGG